MEKIERWVDDRGEKQWGDYRRRIKRPESCRRAPVLPRRFQTIQSDLHPCCHGYRATGLLTLTLKFLLFNILITIIYQEIMTIYSQKKIQNPSCMHATELATINR